MPSATRSMITSLVNCSISYSVKMASRDVTFLPAPFRLDVDGDTEAPFTLGSLAGGIGTASYGWHVRVLPSKTTRKVLIFQVYQLEAREHIVFHLSVCDPTRKRERFPLNHELPVVMVDEHVGALLYRDGIPIAINESPLTTCRAVFSVIFQAFRVP